MKLNNSFSFKKILLVSTSICLVPFMTVSAQSVSQEINLDDYASQPDIIVMPEDEDGLISNDDLLGVVNDASGEATQNISNEVEAFVEDVTDFDSAPVPQAIVPQAIVPQAIVSQPVETFEMVETVETDGIDVVDAADVVVIEDVTDQVVSSVSEPVMVPEPTMELDEVQLEPMSVSEQADDVGLQAKQNIPYSGTYYDSESIGPSELGASAGPRKVDPLYEPGSSFVVVRKSASASSRQANIVAAQRALKLKRYSSALELYETLYKRNPRDPQVLMGMAVSQQFSGFEESAIATYEELLKKHPNHSGAMVNLMGLLESRQPEVAVQKLRKLWSKNSQNPAVAAQLGLVSAKIGDLESSSRYLGIAASLEPHNALHYYNLAIVMDKAKSHSSAIEYYQKALEVDVANSGGDVIPREQVYDRLAQLRRL